MFKKRKERERRLRESFGEIKGEDFDFSLIEKYFRNKDNTDSFQVLSDKTCRDIDFNEVFMFLDRSNSKIGQQFLYNKLRLIPKNSDSIKNDELIVRKLMLDPELRLNAQNLLNKLNKDEAYYIGTLFQEEHLKPPRWFAVVPILAFVNLFSILSLAFNEKAIFVLLSVFVVNLGIHFWNKKNLYQYFGSIPQLLVLNKVAKDLYKNPIFKEVNPTLPHAIKVIDRVRNRMSFFKLDSTFSSSFELVFWTFLELLKAVFLLEPLLLFGVLKELNTKREEIDTVFSFVGQIDALISVASLRKGTQSYCLPVVCENNEKVVAEEAYHPLIANCVKNSLTLKEKSILLTGSNMSGKTSFIRTIGINVITGLTLNTCFAKAFKMPRTRLYSAIRISDDLLNDKSYYFEEVLTIKEMITKNDVEIPNLFLLDEIFKGTNTVERIAAGKAVLSELSKRNNSVFVSTHDIELAELLKEEYELYHFSEVVKNDSVDFDYSLKEGKLTNRNAIRILQINDYPESLIREAMKISNELDKEFNIQASS